ncbi:potassium/proton antiporter membrane subunit, CPA2 family [Abditibacterium utsteinense]|uniref:Potassium/proton antiporter membrane subunit, CPA2 family n=1 Tax=Abditibacterium utsteinense TaxID=1960156 RepID=A0A2S8SPI6_9BACT|nr:cation:proton antiporter [Abditibacterium utsteinense]PQV62710.1 potassium/proton antiporter membrane subunit, CPA2 family [Abditibacterium utsteinense]
MPEVTAATTVAAHDLSRVFIELGVAIIGLAVLTRLSSRFGFSTIPLYLLAGLAFGNGGLVPLRFSQDIVHIGGEIGVLLLLFMLGLEYTGSELGGNLRSGLAAGGVDFALNFSPGLVVGLLLRWSPLAAGLLGGVTWISSSGVIARVLSELGRMNNPETRIILSVLVLEDLAMAVYLPLVAVLLIGQGFVAGALSISVALLTVSVVLFVAVHYGATLSRWVAHESDEVILFSTLGLVLLVAGVAQRLQVSAAIGAFLVGIALSGPIVKQTERLIGPLRDLFAATFFLFFGLQIDPATLPPVLLLAIFLGLVTTGTKLYSGFWAARRAGIEASGSWRAGAALVARGEFSIVIAGLGAGIEPRLGHCRWLTSYFWLSWGRFWRAASNR